MKTLIPVIVIILTGAFMLFNHFEHQSHPVENKVNITEITTQHHAEQPRKSLTKHAIKETKDAAKKRTEYKQLSESEVKGLLAECGIDADVLNGSQEDHPKPMVDGLVESSLTEEQLVYALFSNPTDGSKLETLNQFSLSNPDAPLPLIALVTECASDIENQICSAELIDRAALTIRNDGSFWLAATAYFAARNDDVRVYDAINKLDESAYFTNNYAKRIKLFMQVAENNQFGQFGTNLVSAIGIEAANTSPYSPIATWCKNEMNDYKKSNACLTLGRNLITRPSTLMNQMFGFGIQKGVHDDENNVKAALELQQQSEEMMQDSVHRSPPYTQLFLLTNEKLAKGWLSNMETLGEFEASKRLNADIEKLVQSDRFEPCRVLFDLPVSERKEQ
ncbi:hypothetical protein [Shewanella phaeophyticola]|uniref:Uncharacterized protein n=1 Tax=Shewanella phaeophyticola TaxID=2978345 RepID=A0ABT2P9T7_9GAMM|nr:hypothetical protein [Shewanella sp. KJ10-1]MCT8988346.1 hypothetical protein [Shewanella sp. KJ10-1]